jgi:CheY-like chemotaxis protein
MEQLKKILWIDDDINRFPLMPYIDEFKEKGYTIVKAENPDESSKIINSNDDTFLCIIADISMPLGENIKFGEAKGGMQTGLVVLKELVDNPKLNSVKKIVFTIVDDGEVRDYCNSQTPPIPYLQKHKWLTDAFVEKIEEIINE